MGLTDARKKRIKDLVRLRQLNLTVVLENVHDVHNISAVLRSCDSVGIAEIYVLYTEAHLTEEKLHLGHQSSAGSRKWVDVHLYRDVDQCFSDIKKKYDHIWATHMTADAVPFTEVDFTQSVALVFGNEKEGISKQSLSHTTGNYIIPQIGMVKSLNISVACAVSLYEVHKQRASANLIGLESESLSEAKEALYQDYLQRHLSQSKGEEPIIH